MVRLKTLFSLALVTGLVACASSAQIPTVTPRSTQITGVVSGGLSMRMDMQIHNPNSYNLDVYAVRARVRAQGHDLGNVESATRVQLVAGQWTSFASEVVVPWGDLPSLAATAILSPSVPYHVDGTVLVRGPAGYTVRVPFDMDGQIPRGMLLQVPNIPISLGL